MMRHDDSVLQFIKNYICHNFCKLETLIIFLYILLNISLNIIFRNFLEATKITISCI